MPTPSSTGLLMRRDDVPTPSQRGREAVGTTEARKPAKRAKPPTVKHAEDARAAKWFDAGVAAYPSAAAYEEGGQIDKGDLSNMRVGKIATALRRLLPMQSHAPSALAFCAEFLADVEVSEHPDDVLLLVGPLLEAIGMVVRPKGAITPEQVGSVATRLLTDTRAAREMLERECQREYGATPKDVELAIRIKGDDK